MPQDSTGLEYVIDPGDEDTRAVASWIGEVRFTAALGREDHPKAICPTIVDGCAWGLPGS